MKGCLSLSLLLLVGAGLFWFQGDAIMAFVEDRRGGPEVLEARAPSAEIAMEARERFESYLVDDRSEIVFSAVELESLIRYELADRLPQGVSDPTVGIRDSEVTLGVKVARELIPRLPDLEGVRQILPDTVPVQLRGRVIGIDSGDAGFVVNRLEASSIPIPSRFIPSLVEMLNPGGGEDLPPEIIRISLPEGVGSVRVVGEVLRLSRRD